jgi:hypothetical protein
MYKWLHLPGGSLIFRAKEKSETWVPSEEFDVFCVYKYKYITLKIMHNPIIQLIREKI